MDNINSIVAVNLKQLREKRKLSLDALAKETGVSKSMLGQIERGDVNPTISTVWKIASGLKISFTELMNRPETEHELIDSAQLEPIVEDDGNFRNYAMFPFDSKRRFELFYIEIDAGSYLDAEPHPTGAQEFITVFSGELTLTVSGEVFRLHQGCAFRFQADCPHGYRNTGSEVCRLSMVIYYPE